VLNLIASKLNIERKSSLPDAISDPILAAIAPTDNSSRNWYEYGYRLQVEWKKYKKSELAYIKSIEIDPNNNLPLNNLGNLLSINLNKKNEAEECYIKSIKINPNNEYTWCNLGICQTTMGKYDESEKSLRKAIEINPMDTPSWVQLGILLSAYLFRFNEAEQCFRKATGIDPSDISAWNSLGILLSDFFSRHQEAELCFKKITSILPGDTYASSNLVFLYRDMMNRIQEAKESLAHIKSWNGVEDSFNIHHALFAAYESNWEMARANLHKAHEAAKWQLPPDTCDDWFRAAAVLLKLGYGPQYVEAIREWEAEEDVSMPPWFAAIDAHVKGDRRYLLNIAPEVRTVAETIYDQIQIRRDRLPKG
jgi:tetratricopeptide (TPR) repeat protein